MNCNIPKGRQSDSGGDRVQTGSSQKGVASGTSPSISQVQVALWPEKQVATFLHVSVQTLRKWRANGVGPAWARMGGCIRYPIDGLHEYIAASRCDFTGQDKTCSSIKNGGARHG